MQKELLFCLTVIPVLAFKLYDDLVEPFVVIDPVHIRYPFMSHILLRIILTYYAK